MASSLLRYILLMQLAVVRGYFIGSKNKYSFVKERQGNEQKTSIRIIKHMFCFQNSTLTHVLKSAWTVMKEKRFAQ